MTPTTHSDAELLRLMGAGDEHAFVTLYEKHQGAVYRFATARGTNRAGLCGDFVSLSRGRTLKWDSSQSGWVKAPGQCLPGMEREF